MLYLHQFSAISATFLILKSTSTISDRNEVQYVKHILNEVFVVMTRKELPLWMLMDPHPPPGTVQSIILHVYKAHALHIVLGYNGHCLVYSILLRRVVGHYFILSGHPYSISISCLHSAILGGIVAYPSHKANAIQTWDYWSAKSTM